MYLDTWLQGLDFIIRKIEESVNQLTLYSRKWLVVLNVFNLCFSLFLTFFP